MRWNKEVRENIKEASLATRYDCLNEDGELDRDEWVLKTRELLEEEYTEEEHDFQVDACLYMIQHQQHLMNRLSRQRVYSYVTTNSEASGDGVTSIEGNGGNPAEGKDEPQLPTYDSLKGEMVTVPQVVGRPTHKLVLKCTLSEIEAVAGEFGKREAWHNQRKQRYSRIAQLMRNAGLDENDLVEDLYG